MKIVCASSVLYGQEAFSTVGEVVILPEEQITRRDLLDADALITRSKTRITRDLLEGTAVRFVGSAVAGTDHIDAPYIDSTDIAWCHAPGCNANSVAEYVVTALLLEAQKHDLSLSDMTLGVIGIGHIGTRVVEKAEDLGIQVLQNDPPREAMDDEFDGPFVPLDELLPVADIVTLHVPLTTIEHYGTQGMVNHRFIESMKPGALLFNTARGEIIDSDAFMAALEHGMIRQAVLDVWENEPAIRKDVLDAVDIGTPHIAGYSLEGRLNGTQMVYDELCHFLEIEPVWLDADLPDAGPTPEQVVDGRNRSEREILASILATAYPILADDLRFREGASADPAVMGRHFVHCRRNYPVRREFAACRLQFHHVSDELISIAWALGFQIAV